MRQIRDIVDCDSRVAAAIDRDDECGALRGWDSNIATIPCSPRASSAVRGDVTT
ncbi:hypothetical protein [Micromonospora zamorensis]|uniref:hypothetical protein n=1 Tax=Micromonospora zamorensis TaxID=709883 RepID=UPI0037B06F18